MIKKSMLFMLAFVGLMIASCTTEVQYEAPNKPISKDGVLFRFTLPSGDAVFRSRGVMPESGENKVNDLTVLFFEPTTNGTGKLVGFYKAPSNLLPSQNENQFSLEIESMTGAGIVKTNPYSILALANMLSNMFATEADLDTFLTSITGKSENEVMNYAIMQVKGVADDNTSMTGGINNENLPMSAQSKKEANVDVVGVQLIRTVSRFDVTNATLTHKVMSVSVWNAFTQATVWEKGYMDYSQARTRRFYGRNFPAGQEYMRGGVYAFQNVSTSPEQNDAKTTCLIIGIQQIGVGVTTYYRVNIHSSESGQYLKRNNAYQVTIQGVSGIGEDSEINAYVKGKILLNISINSWDRDEDGLIIRDGDNLLAIPTRKARFSPESEQRQYYVYTLGTGTLELIKLDMPTGMDAWLGGANGKDLFISVDNYTFDQRKGSIELRFAGMKGIIEIIQSGATEKSLKLSHTSVPLYPAGKRTDMLGANPILITSSGSWTAEIFGTDFSFEMSSTTENKITGDNAGYINNIYSNSINGNPQSRTNFVLITLDEDPDNYRNVLVLTQSGIGGFTLNPNNTAVQFNADKTPNSTAGNTNILILTPGSINDDTWTVDLSGTNADKFSVTVTDATPVSATEWKGIGTITITALDTNYTGTYSATMKITHNGTNTKDIAVTQDFYNLVAVLLSSTPIPETGGSREVRIASNSSQSLGWTATLEGKPALALKGFTPYFIGSDGKPIMDGANYATTITGMTPTNVKVGMIGINKDIRAEGAPEATVTAMLTAVTSVKATPVVIKQDPVKYYSIYAQTLTATYGRLDVAEDYSRMFRNELMNAASFGPTGASKVYAKITPNLLDAPSYTVFNNNSGDNRKRIINANGNNYLNTNTTNWDVFKNDPYVVFIMSDHAIFLNKVFNNTGFGGFGFSIATTNIPVAYPRKITAEPRTVNSEIYKWLIGGEGPFGVVNTTSFVLNSFDGANCTLIDGAWPETFIPLIRYSNGNCIVGIDPTLRMIWIGDTEIFTNTYPGSQPNNDSADAMAFLRNLQAWIIMTNNYGDSFNERFKMK